MTWKVKSVRGETPSSQSNHEAFPKNLVGNKFVDCERCECDPWPAIFPLLLSDALAQ